MNRPSKNKINFARSLRKRMTTQEVKLWQAIRRRQLLGLHFRKQAPIGVYVADFLCYEARIIIELDGGQHNEDEAILYDKRRTAWLQEQGYEVLRFWNNDITYNLSGVIDTILELCNQRIPPSYPSPARGEG